MTHKSIAATLQGYEGEKAVIVTGDGQRLSVPKDSVPMGVEPGQTVYVSLNKEQSVDLKQMAKAAINAILNPKS